MPRGLLIGRFQPFHLGHLAVVRQIRQQRPDESLLLGIGSAQASFTSSNPFTAGERAEMIDRALREAELTDCPSFPIVDIDRHALWVAHVESLVPPFERVHTNNPLTRLLFEKAGYSVESPILVDRDRLQGAVIRERMRSGEAWADLVPPSVATYLHGLGAEQRLRLLDDKTIPPSDR